MAGLNKVMLIGRLGKDPEINTYDNNLKKCKFSLATSESYKNKNGERVEQTEWHNIVIWRGQAEVAEKYLKKGSLIYLEGKIRTRSYDAADGQKKYITEIAGDYFTMLDSKKNNQNPEANTNIPTSDTSNSSENGTNLPF